MCMKMLNNLGKKLGGKFPLTTLGYSMVKSWSKLLATFSFTFAQRSCQVPFDKLGLWVFARSKLLDNKIIANSIERIVDQYYNITQYHYKVPVKQTFRFLSYT